MIDLLKTSGCRPAGMVGDREIPFLSFAAFQRLLDLPLVRFFAVQYGREDAERLIPTVALTNPEVFAEGEWETPELKMELALLVAKRHEWGPVLDFLRFGLPRNASEGEITAERFQAGILAFCQASSFYSPADLAVLPFDYVYALFEAQQALNTNPEDADYVQSGEIPTPPDTPEQRSGVLAAIANAKQVN